MAAECVGDMKGRARARKLEDTRLNLQEQILEKLENISLIEYELEQIRQETK
jgi:hypothetical protein